MNAPICWVLTILASFWDIWQSLPASYPLVKLKCLSEKHRRELAGRPRKSRTKSLAGRCPAHRGVGIGPGTGLLIGEQFYTEMQAPTGRFCCMWLATQGGHNEGT
jgi:hypothetical protein